MKRARVVVLHGAVPENAPHDEQNVLDEVQDVSRALNELGYDPVPLVFTLQLDKMVSRLNRLHPLFVFNLVETVEGDGQLVYLAPALLDYLRIPYTGCPRDAMFLTSNKLQAKRFMSAAGVPTAPWLDPLQPADEIPDMSGRFVIKMIWEHASVGLDDHAVVDVADKYELIENIHNRQLRTGKECFAESYIDGREFNLSLLGGEVLPIPEMKFHNFPENKLKMVDYRAKWIEDSFEFQNTSRTFDIPAEDKPLLDKLIGIGRDCWRLFHLRGYARVDYRVDAANQPYVLEVNANPCISPDSGLFAAVEQTGLNYTQMVEKIVLDSIRHLS